MFKEFNIISYGESLNWWFEYPKREGSDFITIGVNHIGHYCPVDYLLLVDHPAHFTPEKIDTIRRTLPINYFIVDMAWMKYLEPHKCAPISLAAERSNLKTIEGEGLGIFSQLPYSYNSPFIAACLAIRMGAKRINLFGIDFNFDSAVKYDFHPKNIDDFQKFYMFCHSVNIEIYTTPESKLSKFIPINPNLKPA